MDGDLLSLDPRIDGARPGWRIGVTLFVAALLSGNGPAAAIQPDEMHVQGRWVYTQRPDRDSVEHMAATPSIEDAATWLLVTCNGDARLNVALVHPARFPFPIELSPALTVRSVGQVAGSAGYREKRSSEPSRYRSRGRATAHAAAYRREPTRDLHPEGDGGAHDCTFSAQPKTLRSRQFVRDASTLRSVLRKLDPLAV